VMPAGVPDGMRADADGRLGVAGGDGVHVFAPDGSAAGHVALPDPHRPPRRRASAPAGPGTLSAVQASAVQTRRAISRTSRTSTIRSKPRGEMRRASQAPAGSAATTGTSARALAASVGPLSSP